MRSVTTCVCKGQGILEVEYIEEREEIEIDNIDSSNNLCSFQVLRLQVDDDENVQDDSTFFLSNEYSCRVRTSIGSPCFLHI